MKKSIVLVIVIIFTAHCATAQTYSRKYNAAENQINWPEEYKPEKAKFYVHNEIDIAAPPEMVWAILIDAEKWPEWYEGAKEVKLQNQSEPILTGHSVFTWRTMGLDFESTIREFVPNERLSWESSKKQIQGYHAWLIVPTPTGCKVITDESQKGWLTFFEKTFQGKKLAKLHNVWLAKVKKKAESQATSKL